SSSTAGEFGHMIVKKDGPLCSCGRHGCLETFSSGTGIANRMKEQVLKNQDHSAFRLAEKDELTARDVFVACEKGDEMARNVITEAEDYLAITLANMINVLNPSVLVIGGGVMLGQPRYFEAVKEK